MKTRVWILALCLMLLLSACGGAGNPSAPGGTSSESDKTSTPADTPSTGSEAPDNTSSESGKASTPADTPSTGSEAPDNRSTEEVLAAWLHEALEKNPNASSLEIVQDLEERGPFRMFSDMAATEYYPGFDYNMKAPEEIQDAAVLYHYAENDRGFVYIFTLKDGAGDKVEKTLKDSWMDSENFQIITMREGNRLLMAMLPKAFDVHKVIEGEIAKKARDMVQIFLDYRKEHPEAGALEIVDYLNAHQKFNDCFTGQVSEGKLTGLGGKNNFDGTERLELHGFTDGAVLSPMISPNTFLCYVFFVKDASEMSAFEETLKNQADLAWNVCVVANTVITQTDGTAVLFIMCDE